MSIPITRTHITDCRAGETRRSVRDNIMEFYTLQEFMTYTKGITYLLMAAILVGITGFWLFLTDRDED
jgi:hypothetical protein